MRQLFGEWWFFLGEIIIFCGVSRFAFWKTYRFFGKIGVCERDSSGTTEAGAAREGDGADSPTRGAERAEAARPNSFAAKIFIKKIKLFLIIN
jgi:hypothetical protein